MSLLGIIKDVQDEPEKPKNEELKESMVEEVDAEKNKSDIVVEGAVNDSTLTTLV